MQENKIEKLIFGIFFIVGIAAILLGIFLFGKVFNYSNTIDTVGTITKITSNRDYDGDTIYEVSISYSIDGKAYESKINGCPRDCHVGKQIDIYYDKDNPNRIGVKSLDMVFLIFPGLGIIFVIIGGRGILGIVNAKKSLKRLKESGQLIYADYVETILNTSYKVNGRSPYKIICEWVDPTDGNYYKFKSKNIWTNPENIIEQKNITKFPVYINNNNKKKYVVDIDILEENIL